MQYYAKFLGGVVDGGRIALERPASKSFEIVTPWSVTIYIDSGMTNRKGPHETEKMFVSSTATKRNTHRPPRRVPGDWVFPEEEDKSTLQSILDAGYITELRRVPCG